MTNKKPFKISERDISLTQYIGGCYFSLFLFTGSLPSFLADSILLNSFLTDTSSFWSVRYGGLEKTRKETCVGTNVTGKLRKYIIMILKDSVALLHNLMEEKTQFPDFLKQRENGHWTKKWHKIYLL